MQAEAYVSPQASPRIKGFAIRGLLKYVKQRGYPGGIPRILATLSEEDGVLFDERVLSSSWYPYRAFTALLHAIDDELGAGDLSSLHVVGEFSGTQDAGTIFKIVLSLASIERVISIAPPFWKRYCDRGWFEPLESTPGRLRIRLNDFPDIEPGHCQLIAGWIEGLGRTAGAENPVAEHAVCVHSGDPHCVFEASWH